VTSNDPAPASVLDSLARVGADVVRAGLVVGSGGNLSARVGAAAWVTGAGTWLDRLSTPSFARVAVDDGTVECGVPSTEVALHLATYRARPGVRAIVHLHPQTVLLLDALDERIRLVTTDHAFYLRRIGVVPYHPPGTAALASAAASVAAAGYDVMVLRRHGCSVLGDSAEMALRRALNLEEAARLTYRALALGRAADLVDLDPPSLA
jgi:ribulose-5-phosphate 4-epimerase/fuculose-1-phosphate aldolase